MDSVFVCLLFSDYYYYYSLEFVLLETFPSNLYSSVGEGCPVAYGDELELLCCATALEICIRTTSYTKSALCM